MRPKLTAVFLLLGGVIFGFAAVAQFTVATHLHAPSENILRAPELESIIKDAPKLLQKLHDEEAAAQTKITTIVGAHLNVCFFLAVSGAFQIVAGLAILTYREHV